MNYFRASKMKIKLKMDDQVTFAVAQTDKPA